MPSTQTTHIKFYMNVLPLSVFGRYVSSLLHQLSKLSFRSIAKTPLIPTSTIHPSDITIYNTRGPNITKTFFNHHPYQTFYYEPTNELNSTIFTPKPLSFSLSFQIFYTNRNYEFSVCIL